MPPEWGGVLTRPAGRSNFGGFRLLRLREIRSKETLPVSDQIVFLCTGNICRSPLAEVLAVQMFAGLGLSFVSAGLDAVSGLPASGSSTQYATSRGLSLADHRSQPVSADLLASTAWVIGMSRSHAAIFRSRYRGAYKGHVGILGAPGLDLASGGPSPAVEEVNDPYGLPSENYFACGDQIHRLLPGWAPIFKALSAAATADSAQENET